MIPSTNNKLLVAEDWKKIYQSFNNSDFKSYDFETLRRTMITYLRENYPEDFNDYIDSSEYVALIDLIAYLGQNLSFRVDLNARENFLETAQRRESILRLAQLINYNPKRNTPANGFLKITSISTTENITDANGVNLSNTPIAWNDPSNSNWYQQFLTVINNAMPADITFGKPYDRKSISGIPTEQYKINSAITDVPLFTFSKSVSGVSMEFEIVSSTFAESTYIKESTPLPGSNFSFIFRNDSRGSASANTGFFVHFRQGTLGVSSFSVDTPVANEVVGIDIANINDTDVWLWQLDGNGNYGTEWTKVSNITGNNIIYNSLDISKRNIYAVTSRDQDQIDLTFADGAFGNLPKGNFKLFYRQSNGLQYSIKPDQMNGIQIQVPYVNKGGQRNTITFTLSLQYTVNNSSAPETNDNIKLKAPQAYYTQNRMITAEDYNIAPLTAGTDILKVKSVNRISSGISKYFELSDVSGKYSTTNIYGSDGALYKDIKQSTIEFSFDNRNDIYSVIQNQIIPIVESDTLRDFYFDNYPRPDLQSQSALWQQLTSTTNQSTGYFKDKILGTPLQTGFFSSNNLSYVDTGALVKYVPGDGYVFAKNGKRIPVANADSTTSKYMWSKIALVIGDGANAGAGALANGTGPIVATGYVPTDAVASSVIPNFSTVFSYSLQNEIINLCLATRNFGIAFSADTRSWYIINDTNLNTADPFTLVYQKDVSNSNRDTGWMFAFLWNGTGYEVVYRTSDYIFESKAETAFFYDGTDKNYDFVTNTVVKDKISVLGINTVSTSSFYSLGKDYHWQVNGNIVEADGYVEPKKVKVSFFDAQDDGQIDNPDSFEEIVISNSTSSYTTYKDKFVYFKNSADELTYSLVDSSNFLAYPIPDNIPADMKIEGQLYYFYDYGLDYVASYSTATSAPFTLEPSYYAKPGRHSLKFHYVHNSGDSKRLDPSKTNLIDVFILSSSYDTTFRAWLSSGAGTAPLPPTSSSLETNYSAALEPIKAISDSIVYQPAIYKVLFGTTANKNLQATFKAVRNSTRSISDNDIKSRILTAINEFFSLDNWDFGQPFYFSELSTYVMNTLSPDITNFILVPKADVPFGSLYEIACQNNEIFVSGVTATDIEVIDTITSSQIKTTSTIINSSVGAA